MVVSKFLSRYVRCSSAKILLWYKAVFLLYTRLDFGYCYIHSQNLRHIDSREEYFLWKKKRDVIRFTSRRGDMTQVHVHQKCVKLVLL